MGYYGFGRQLGMGYYGFDWTYILVIIGFVITMIASFAVKNTFAKYAKRAAACGLTGAEVAMKILKKSGAYDVEVGRIRGSLTDHYNPSAKVLNLSESVYGSTSIAAIGVAAHECGHAMQHSENYFPLKLRSSIVPFANFGSKVGIPCILIGILFSYMQPLITLGVILFSFGVVFQLVTLPVEFDASRRALCVLREMDILTEQEIGGARAVLKSAALTYVASAAAAILSLLRLILLFGGGRRRD